MTVPRGEPYVLRVALKPGSVEPETITVRLRQGREIIATTPMVRFSAGDFRWMDLRSRRRCRSRCGVGMMTLARSPSSRSSGRG